MAIFGTVPDQQRTEDQRGPFWRGRFSEVSEQPGLFQVKAPKGLLNATLVDAEVPTGPRQKWTRAVSEGENVKGPRAETGWNVLDRDDDSILVGEPAASSVKDSASASPVQDSDTNDKESTASDIKWEFVPTKPTKVDFVSSGTSEILNDGSVQLSDSGNWQEFNLRFAAADLPTAIQTMRLEIFPPASSQSRSDKTVMLSDVKPWLTLKSGKTTSLEFVSCKYLGDAEDESTVNCIDWLSDTAWKVPAFSEQNTSHQLVLRFADPIVIDDASELGITIDAGGSAELGTLSRVRVLFADATVNEPNTNTANADAAPTTAGTRRVITVNDVPLSFRWCPPGEFLMGSPEDKRSQYGDAHVTQHRVKISRGFWLQETEVTQAQYEMVTGEKPSFWQPLDDRAARALGREHTTDNPVEQVSWTDASWFCQELTKLDGKHRFRLPTEAEWEYACRAGRPECRYGGINDIAWVFENTEVGFEGSFGHRAVGKKLPNAWGLHDMLGNVSEWCSDWFGPPATQLTIDPTGPASGTDRIARGGNCFADPGELRTDGACMAGTRNRDGGPPHDKLRTRGFRIVLADGNNPNASP
ncbi:MAG: SUMF1/EgtB/PvdO family nonheme iron enzyme [Pirellulaceae bacterium]